MNLKIHHKITLIFILINAVILLGVFIFLSDTLTKHTFERIRANVAKQMDLCKTYLMDIPIRNLYNYDIDKISDKIGKDLGLRVTLISIDGEVYGDSEVKTADLPQIENHLYRPEVQQALKTGKGENRRFSTTIKEDFLYTASVFEKNGNRSIIRLSIPLSEIEDLLKYLRQLLSFSLILAFILSGAVSYLASLLISKPIRHISEISDKIAKGDYSKKILVPTHDEIGDLASTFNNMTAQINKRMTEISENRSRLEAVLLSMFEGVMVVDSSQSILLMNQALMSFLKIKNDPIGKRPIEATRNLQIQDIVESTLSSKQRLISKEIATLLPEEKFLLIHATPIKKADKIEGAVLVFHDVTELRRLENIRRDFVANVSHELRTPISSIKGYAETLLDTHQTDDENVQDFLRIILSDANRLANLIDDLLNLSKIESGKLTMETKPVKLVPNIKKLHANLKSQMKKKGIKLEIDIPNKIPKVLVDEIRLEQVLLNLLDNAIKYNKESGQITVRASELANFVKISIIDSGIGIPEKDLPRLFERFYRVDKARSRDLGGTGLGLSIVKHIIQANGGDVAVESIEGQGSTFSFTLPKA